MTCDDLNRYTPAAACGEAASLARKVAQLSSEQAETQAELDKTFFLNFGKRGELSDRINALQKEGNAQAKALEQTRKAEAQALERANMAERHWQRLPPEVIAERKAQIYELQAKASRGLLNNTDDEARQRELVEQSLRFWRRYAQQVNSDTSLVEKANAEIASLEDIRRRLE